MALTVSRSDLFPVGTSVGAYPRAARHSGGAPAGSATESATVAADGTLKYTTLTADKPYTLYASISGEPRYLNVEDSGFTAPPTGLVERIDERRVAAGIE